MSKSKIGVCPECKVKEYDSTEKTLYQCAFCGRFFCAKHFDPRLAGVTDVLHPIKDVRIRHIFEEDWRREGGHPDFAYTRKRLQELDMEKELLNKLMKDILDRSRSYRKAVTPKKEITIPHSFTTSNAHKYCPKCKSKRFQTTAYHRDYTDYECLDCGFKWKVPKSAKPFSKKPILKKIIAFSLILVILGVVLYNSPFIIPIVQEMVSQILSRIYQPKPTYSHQELVNYALSLINKDRLDHGLSNVSLSLVESGQEHAQNMLEHHYLSHWDIKGYKPYMRYALAGGQGAVAENCGWQYTSGSFDVKDAIKNLEWSMMYDDADSDWGHRDNILDPFHNKVSIGIAYDNHNVYYVQDFEDDYIEWSTFMEINSKSEVTLSGSFQRRQLSVESINIFYDAYPTNLTSDQLNSLYTGSYFQGTFVGMVLPPNYESVDGITITAQKWMQTDNHFQIRFGLSQAFNAYRKGVYTLYLQSDSESYHYLTSYSFWNN